MIRIGVALVLSCIVLAARSPAETTEATSSSSYRVPDSTIVRIIDAPRTPLVHIGPDREWLLVAERPSYPSIAELAEREIGLAGTRIKPQTNGASRTNPSIGLAFLRIADGEQRPVAGLPASPRIENLSWSPDGQRIAFTNTTASGIELWVAELSDGIARRLVGPRLSLVAGEGPVWLSGSRAIIACLVPEGRGAEPGKPAIPDGPIVQESVGKAAPARTYQDLLQSPHDEDLFVHYFTTQLARIDLDGSITPLGREGIIWDFDPSPNGEYILVQTIHPPFSYLVTGDRFPMRVEIWSARGEPVHMVTDRPLQEGIPITYGSVETGPREFVWRADAQATLCWAEALDGGDAGKDAELRDAVYLLDAPFKGRPVLWTRLPIRYGGTTWGRGDLAVIAGWWWKTRNQRLWCAHPDQPDVEAELLIDRSWEDRYSDPGEPVLARNAAGRLVLLIDSAGEKIYFRGAGASPEGDRPFLDRFDLTTRRAERLFRSEAPHYEESITVLDPGGGQVLTRRESVTEVPNYFVRDLGGGGLRQLTFFAHPTPQLVGFRKELIQYRRADSVALSAKLYLPVGYRADEGPLPMVMWAYPEEYKSADAAGQITDSPHRFDWVGWWSPLLWLTQGYAVLDDLKMPIVGEGDQEPNDTFLDQLVASAEAAVEEVVRRGVADRRRIAIGGHSYGAFMAVNLLAHSDLFAAGLARTGAYNRTLTPFGFQSEERTLWEAPEVYFAMSPFMHADKIDEPLLLVHGEADSNPGTFPMQSERLYNAMKGMGGTVRLVMLPHESHNYRARESILHLMWETQEWLDRFVKNRAP